MNLCFDFTSHPSARIHVREEFRLCKTSLLLLLMCELCVKHRDVGVGKHSYTHKRRLLKFIIFLCNKLFFM